MKLTTVCLVSVLQASAAMALTSLGPSDRTAGDVFRENERRHPLNVNMEGPSEFVILPGAANAAGQFGAYFRTDLFITATGANRDGETLFTLFVLPAGTNGNQNVRGEDFRIPVGGFGIIKDVVGRAGVSGGATIVLSVDHGRSSAASSDQYLSAWAKTYTASPSGGEYSTTLPSLGGYNLTASSFVAVAGVQQNGAKRTNVSTFNHSASTTLTVQLVVFSSTGQNLGSKNVTVAPLTNIQVSLSEFSIADPGGVLRAILVSGTGASVFAVTVDNATNDGDLKLLTYNAL